MVTIVSYNKRTSEAGKEFFSLTVQSGIEMIRSKTTGQFYATAKKASIASTFDELTCNALLRTEMPGNISKKSCEPNGIHESTVIKAWHSCLNSSLGWI